MLAAIVVGYSSVTKTGTGGAPYVIFALTGLTVWTFIQLSVTLGAQAILGNSSLVRRSPLPRIALVTGSLLGNLPPVTIMLTITLILAVALRGLPLQALLLPVLIAWLFGFTLAVAMMFAALAARFRDTVSVLPLVIQAGIFVSPVGYSLHGAPTHVYSLLAVNPVTGLIEAWRWALLGIPDPKWTVMAIAAGWTLALGVLGWRVFGRLEVEFADVV
jgi:lipopolysaccharide transport system permease protein